MALFDEKFYLEVIQGYTSDETKKARRNLSATAFIISVIYLLDFTLQDMRVFGLSMEGKSGTSLTWIAFVLLTYWFLLYIMQLITDNKINDEKEMLLKQMTTHIEDEFRIYKAKEQRKSSNTSNISGLSAIDESLIDDGKRTEFITAYTAYKEQKTRTNFAKFMIGVTKLIHTDTPLFLCLFAYYALIRMLLA